MKKLILVLLFAAAAVYAAGSEGKLFVHISGTFDVLVDGVSRGQTSVQEGGKILALPTGPHHVTVRSAEGREGSFDVTITAGQTQEVMLSPLGLRKKLATPAGDAGSGALHVACIPSDCAVNFKPPVDAVPPGRYPLVVNRGSSMLRMDVDVPESTIVTVEANFTNNTIRMIDSRRRPRRLAVAEINDGLTRLAVPSYWKTAIRGALPAGIGIESAIGYDNAVRVTLRVPTAEVGNSMLNSVVRSSAFADVVAPSVPRSDKIGWLFDLIFFFPEK